ncbi:MAG: septum formation initiator family protein [Verrucomicrobiota bacterium]
MLIFLGSLGIVAAKFWPEIQKLRRLEDRTAELLRQAHSLELERDRLREEYRLLRDDLDYLEAVARDRLDLAKPGETVFRFVPPRRSSEVVLEESF